MGGRKLQKIGGIGDMGQFEIVANFRNIEMRAWSSFESQLMSA